MRGILIRFVWRWAPLVNPALKAQAHNNRPRAESS